MSKLRRLEKEIRDYEESDSAYLIIHQANKGQYNSNSCVRVSFIYNSMPDVLVRVEDKIQSVERDTDEFGFLKIKENGFLSYASAYLLQTQKQPQH